MSSSPALHALLERFEPRVQCTPQVQLESRLTATILAAATVRPVVTLFELEQELCEAEGVATFSALGLGASIKCLEVTKRIFKVSPSPPGVSYREDDLVKITSSDFIAFLASDPVARDLVASGSDAGALCDAFARSLGYQRARRCGIHVTNLPALIAAVEQQRQRFPAQIQALRRLPVQRDALPPVARSDSQVQLSSVSVGSPTELGLSPPTSVNADPRLTAAGGSGSGARRRRIVSSAPVVITSSASVPATAEHVVAAEHSEMHSPRDKTSAGRPSLPTDSTTAAFRGPLSDAGAVLASLDDVLGQLVAEGAPDFLPPLGSDVVQVPLLTLLGLVLDGHELQLAANDSAACRLGFIVRSDRLGRVELPIAGEHLHPMVDLMVSASRSSPTATCAPVLRPTDAAPSLEAVAAFFGTAWDTTMRLVAYCVDVANGAMQLTPAEHRLSLAWTRCVGRDRPVAALIRDGCGKFFAAAETVCRRLFADSSATPGEGTSSFVSAVVLPCHNHFVSTSTAVVFVAEPTALADKFASAMDARRNCGVFVLPAPCPSMLQAWVTRVLRLPSLTESVYSQVFFNSVDPSDSAGLQLQLRASVKWIQALLATRFPAYYKRVAPTTAARLASLRITVCVDPGAVHTIYLLPATLGATAESGGGVSVRVSDLRGLYVARENTLYVSQRCLSARHVAPLLARIVCSEETGAQKPFEAVQALVAATFGAPDIAAAVTELGNSSTIFRVLASDVAKDRLMVPAAWGPAWDVPHGMSGKFHSTFPPGTDLMSLKALPPLGQMLTEPPARYDASVAAQFDRERREVETRRRGLDASNGGESQRQPPQPPAEVPTFKETVVAPRRYARPCANRTPGAVPTVEAAPLAVVEGPLETPVASVVASPRLNTGADVSQPLDTDEAVHELVLPDGLLDGQDDGGDFSGFVSFKTRVLPCARGDPSVVDAQALRSADGEDVSRAAEALVHAVVLKGTPFRGLLPGDRREVKWANEHGESGLPYDVVESIISSSGAVDRRYIEVKSTLLANRRTFELSLRELIFATEQGARFSVYRVFNARGAASGGCKITCVDDPIAAWKRGRLVIKASVEAMI
jgi:hypothetical protein